MTTRSLTERLDALEAENQLLHARVAELEATSVLVESVRGNRAVLRRASAAVAARRRTAVQPQGVGVAV